MHGNRTFVEPLQGSRTGSLRLLYNISTASAQICPGLPSPQMARKRNDVMILDKVKTYVVASSHLYEAKKKRMKIIDQFIA